MRNSQVCVEFVDMVIVICKTDFMEGIIEKYGWKKVAIVLILLSLTGLVLIFTSFTRVDRRANQTFNERKIEEEKIRGNASDYNSGSNPDRIYTTPFYIVTFPDYYELVPLIPSSGALHLLKLQDTGSSAVIEILVLSNSTLIDSFTQMYDGSGLTRREYNLPSGPVIEYSGKLLDTDIHHKVGFITKENTTIRFLGTYEGKEYEEEIEQIFSDILTGIR